MEKNGQLPLKSLLYPYPGLASGWSCDFAQPVIHAVLGLWPWESDKGSSQQHQSQISPFLLCDLCWGSYSSSSTAPLILLVFQIWSFQPPDNSVSPWSPSHTFLFFVWEAREAFCCLQPTTLTDILPLRPTLRHNQIHTYTHTYEYLQTDTDTHTLTSCINVHVQQHASFRPLLECW